MAQRDEIKTLHGYTQFAILKNLEGVTQAQSVEQPRPGGNCINWVLGHIVHHRNVMLSFLGEASVWGEAEKEPYVRGSEPLTDPKRALPVEKLLADIEATHAKLEAALDRASDEDLARATSPERDTPVGTTLVGLQFHEAYHAGQLGILRRLAGMEPALR